MMCMKNKKILIILASVLIVSVLIVGVCFLIKNDKQSSNDEINSICNEINSYKKSKDNFVVVIMSKRNVNGDAQDAITKFKSLYKDLTIIYDVDFSVINNKCFAETFNDTGAYDLLKKNNSVVTIIGYKNGSYEGMMQNETSPYSIEDYLVKLGVIEKKEIKEDISYEDYKKNKDLNEYLLLIVSEEDVKDEVSDNMKKVFPDLKQDTINKRSVVGEKILKDIESNFKLKNVYPQVFYFKNGKVVASEGVFSEKNFEKFKTSLEK